MNRNIALVFSIALAAAALHAQTTTNGEITIDPNPFVSTLTRAEVRADLERFRRSGVDPTAQEYNPLAKFQSGRTRAEVTAEYLAERSAVAAFGGEDSGSVYLARRPQLPRDIQYAKREMWE
jgi:hypothetical protein